MSTEEKVHSNYEVMDEDRIELPEDTLEILNEFLYNKCMQETLEADQKTFEEDWQLSQFWYNEKTIRSLAKLCLKLILERHQYVEHTSQIAIGLLSCPSIYKSIKALHSNGVVRLFEFDTRFSAFGSDFVYYDYKDVHTNFKKYENYFDIIISDPPFLSKECIEGVANMINLIKKENANIIMCSGKMAENWIKESLMLNLCKFQPEHERNLANEFCSYANFDLDRFVE